MENKSKWAIGVGIPAALSATFFIGAELYTPSTEATHISIDRQDQGNFVVDVPLVALDVFGTLFAIQAINHTSMIMLPPKKKRSTDSSPEQ